METPSVLTIPEVAERLRVAPTTVYALIARDYRPLPAAKCGKQYRVREDDLWKWFSGEETSPEPHRRGRR